MLPGEAGVEGEEIEKHENKRTCREALGSWLKRQNTVLHVEHASDLCQRREALRKLADAL